MKAFIYEFVGCVSKNAYAFKVRKPNSKKIELSDDIN